MGFFSAVKKFFGRVDDTAKDATSQTETATTEINAPEESSTTPEDASSVTEATPIAGQESALSEEQREEPLAVVASESTPDSEETSAGDTAPEGQQAAGEANLTLRLRQAEPRLSAWLEIVLEGVDEVSPLLWERLHFLLRALDAPQDEAENFVGEFRTWVENNEYELVQEFRSELQYRLALALDMEDEEDERSRLFIKISEGLAKTREHLARGLNSLFAAHGELNDSFWDELTELFIMADLGYDTALALVERLRERAAREGVKESSSVRHLLRAELEEIFRQPRQISAVNPPEVVLFIGVNGVGKTTTIAKLAQRARMQGKKVLIAAADTFRAAAIEQLQVWAERVGALFHAKAAGSDPASVAFEAMDIAVREKVDILFVDTAGRLQTKTNLMEELGKIRQVLGKKHPGAPHRTVLVIDATTGQNALSQTKLFKEAAGVDEIILTKLDGTAKGGVAIAVAMQYHLPITFVGLGEKLEDLRPFDGDNYACALLGESGDGQDS